MDRRIQEAVHAILDVTRVLAIRQHDHAFGHQHIGLTCGPATGRIIARLLKGEAPNVDLAPFRPDRF